MTRSTSDLAVDVVPLADCIDRAVTAMWPRRAHQELLFDLGERKQWDHGDRRAAVEEATAWLVRALGLPPVVSVCRDGRPAGAADEHARALAQQLGRAACRGETTIGIAAWLCGIAPALGSTAKTLANSLSGAIRTERSD